MPADSTPVVVNSSDMAKLAHAANAVVRHIRDAIDHFAPEQLTTRQRLARALLTSSIDHSVALTHLLAKEDPYCAYSAISLFRPQLDALARGTFFALPELSADTEVEAFLATGHMPERVPPTGGKPRTPHLKELLASTRVVLKPFLPENLAAHVDSAFTYDLDIYNGFVHGGGKVVQAYTMVNHHCVFLPDFYQAMLHSRHSVAQANLAEAILAAHVYRVRADAPRLPGRNEIVAEYGQVADELERQFWQRDE